MGDFHTILNGNLRRHTKQADVPRCPVHGVEMRPSSYGKNQWYCSQSDERGAYCREKYPVSTAPRTNGRRR